MLPRHDIWPETAATCMARLNRTGPAPAQVLDHMHGPARLSVHTISGDAYVSAAKLLRLALAVQASRAKAGPGHPAAVPHYTAAQLRRLVGDAHQLSLLLCQLANLAVAAGSGQQAGCGSGQVYADLLELLGQAMQWFEHLFEAAEDSAALLPDAETLGRALAAVEAMLRTVALSLQQPILSRAGACGSSLAAMYRLPRVYKELWPHLNRAPLQHASAAELLRPAQALVLTAVKLRRCDMHCYNRQAPPPQQIYNAEQVAVDDVLMSLLVAVRVLRAQPGLPEGRQHVTRHLQLVGYLMFAAIPALLRSEASAPKECDQGTAVMHVVSGTAACCGC